MNTATHPGTPYTVPPEPSRLPSILLAVGMHALLLAFLYIGVNWQNTEPVTVEAEVWDMRVQDAAPAPAPEPPPPPPEPEPAPRPEPQPAPRPEPVKEVEPPPPAKPDIALERKKQKELEKKELEAKQLKEKQQREERLAEEKRQKEELKKKELAEKKEEEKKKLAEEKKQKELAEKKEKEKAEKLAKAKAAEEQKRLDKLRAAEMARITGAAGSGTAAQSTAPRVDEGYQRAIVQKIKSNTSYFGQAEGNPRVEFKVEQLPTGEIVSARMTKSSGIPAFDEAVEKGIMKSSPLPKKKDGTVDRTVTVGYRLKDFD